MPSDLRGDARRGRILLFAHHFPPAQTAGALRWHQLAVHAVGRGWGLDVVTRPAEAWEIADASTAAGLPESIQRLAVSEAPGRVLRAIRALAAGLRTAAGRLRAGGRPALATGPGPASTAPGRPHSFARDEVRFHPARLQDWRRAILVLEKAIEGHDYALRLAAAARPRLRPAEHRLVVSCGPPHMQHEAARRVARAARLPLVLDLRDPWSLAQRLIEDVASPLYIAVARHYEARAVREAALVVMNTEAARRAMQQAYPSAKDRIIAVPNGTDPGSVPRNTAPGDPFRIAYAGSIYLDRNPASLFRAVGRVVGELELSPKQLEVAFMGLDAVGAASLRAAASEAGIEPFLRVEPRGPRRDAERLLASAQVLVNLHQDSDMSIPSKLFEYMRHEAALLVLAEPGSATYELVADAPVDLVAPGDVDGIADALLRRFREHASGRVPQPVAVDPRFSRRRQAERLFDAFDALCGGAH